MTEEILHRNADPVKVKLIKGQKDSYGWEISIQGTNNLDIIKSLQEADAELRRKYQPRAEEE